MEGSAHLTSPDGRWVWDGAAWRPLEHRAAPGYAAGAVRAAYAAAFLGALVLVSLVEGADRLYDASLFLFALTGSQQVGEGGYATINAGAVVLTAVRAVLWVCAVVAFARWLHRVAANLPALGGGDLRFTPGWAVAWWFVPFANLVAPPLIVAEAWKASDPGVGATDRAARSRLPVGALIPLWWTCWMLLLVVMVVGQFVSTAYTDQEKLVLFATAGAESVATAVCFALTLVLVLMVDARQTRKRSVAEAAPAPAR
jgi:hypothetical protein